MILYKYSGEVGIRILDELRVKITPPNELNDPFELTPYSRNRMTRRYIVEKAETDPEHFRPILAYRLKEEGITGTLEELVEVVKQLSHRTYRSFLRQYRQALIDADFASPHEASEYLLILCLSARRDSIPMWSHYADHHKGLVIGFNAADRCMVSGPPADRVRYRSRRVSINKLGKPTKAEAMKTLIDVLLTKSRHWAYEEEYRVIHHMDYATGCLASPEQLSQLVPSNRHLYFRRIWPTTIREVIFGCRVSKEFESKVRSVLEMRRFSHVRLFRAKQNRSCYSLDVEDA